MRAWRKARSTRFIKPLLHHETQDPFLLGRGATIAKPESPASSFGRRPGQSENALDRTRQLHQGTMSKLSALPTLPEPLSALVGLLRFRLSYRTFEVSRN